VAETVVEKSVVLIDAQNVYGGWKAYCNSNGVQEKIDYAKLVKKLSEGTNLLRAYFYDGIPESIPKNKKNFFDALQHHGIQLRTKILKTRTYTCPKCGSTELKDVQKGVDVSLATDILRHAWQNTCEVCIVVSGDEDYKDAIECAKDKGIRVIVASFKRSLSAELRNVDKVILLDDIFDDIKMTKQ